MPQPLTFFLLFWVFMAGSLCAKGTTAGTSVENQAAIVYTLGVQEYNLTTNRDIFVVDQVIDVDISWQDSSPVEVGAGESYRVLTFLLSNLGNGEDTLSLYYEHNTSSDFLPQGAQIFQDSDGNGVFNIGVDTVVSDINLSADSNSTLFIVSDIPENNSTIAEADSYDAIRALSINRATPGADRQEGVDLVIRTGEDRAQGSYTIRDYWLTSHKTAVIHSDDNQTHTGTVITYRIELSIGGNAEDRTIDHLMLLDVIPTGTVYQVGTLRLDDVSLTDVVDTDQGALLDNEVRVKVGVLHGGTPQVITFDVRVQ